MPTPAPRKGLDHRAYRRATKRLRAASSVCGICGKEIDQDRYGGPCNAERCPRDEQGEIPEHFCWKSPWSWTADHIVPRSKGGALLGELRPAHRGCNSARGNRENTEAERMPTTREW